MALTKDDLDALDEAIVSGELVVEIDGRKVQYRSVDELQKARRHCCAVLAKQNGTKRRRAFDGVRIQVDRGIR